MNTQQEHLQQRYYNSIFKQFFNFIKQHNSEKIVKNNETSQY